MAFLAEKEKDAKPLIDDQVVEELDRGSPLRADILGSIAGADPNSPGYLGKINHLITAHGAVDKLNPDPDFSGMTSDNERTPSMRLMSPMGTPSSLMTPAPTPPAPPPPTPTTMASLNTPRRGFLGKIGHGLARMGNIAGDILAPGLMEAIPGTDMHKRFDTAITDRNAARDRELAVRETTAEADKSRADTEARKETFTEAQAGKPKPKEEEWINVPTLQGPNGEPVEYEKTSGQYRFGDLKGAKQSRTPGETQEQNKLAFQAVAGKLDAAGLPTGLKDIDKSLDAALKKGIITPAEHATARAYQAANPTPATNLQVTIAGAQQKQGFEHTETQEKETYKRYETAQDAEQRLSRMEASYQKALKGDQQAMLALLTDHIGMTLGLQKGARITKDILNEAQESQPLLAGIEAKFDSRGILSGVTLGPDQMAQMLDLGYEARDRAVQGAHDSSDLYGVQAPPGAEKVFGKRKMGEKPALQGGAGGPKVGDVENGYRFKGGDPKDKSNWEKVKSAGR